MRRNKKEKEKKPEPTPVPVSKYRWSADVIFSFRYERLRHWKFVASRNTPMDVLEVLMDLAGFQEELKLTTDTNEYRIRITLTDAKYWESVNVEADLLSAIARLGYRLHFSSIETRDQSYNQDHPSQWYHFWATKQGVQ